MTEYRVQKGKREELDKGSKGETDMEINPKVGKQHQSSLSPGEKGKITGKPK